jgi:mitochondrial intermediate peptidase
MVLFPGARAVWGQRTRIRLLARTSSLASRRNSLSLRWRGHLPTTVRLFGTQYSETRPGLFGLPGLHYPADWGRLSQNAVEEVGRVREIVYSKLDHPDPSILDDLDHISYTLCEVVDVAELCRSVHVDERFRRAAEETVHNLSDFLHALGHDERLYASLNGLIDNQDVFNSLSEEQKLMAKMMKNDFEKDGVHLEKSAQKELRKINGDISLLESEYISNASQTQGYLVIPANRLGGLPSQTLQQATEKKMLAHFQLSSDAAVLHSSMLPTVLATVKDRGVRESVYRHFSALGDSNVKVLEKLLEKRYDKALLMGFDSFIAQVASEQMLGSPEAIKKFLLGVLSTSKDKIQDEMTLLKTLKGHSENGGLQPWDLPYYMAYAKGGMFQSNHATLRSHFELENTLAGLSFICERLFGMKLVQQELLESEDWTMGRGPKNSVRKLVVYDQDGVDEVGTVYLDLYRRDNKLPGATHFALRHSHRMSDGSYQMPAVVLVTNFNEPASSGSFFTKAFSLGDSSGGDPTLLSHAEATTLFHEFGHALHTLTSRTRFQHLAGTRVKTDFVEIPSHLMEYFLRDFRVLEHFATHHKTKERLSQKSVDQIQDERALFSGINLESQVLWALLDQAFHGPYQAGSSSTDILKDIMDQHMSLPYVEKTLPHATFRHFVNYAGTYYSYLHARVYAAMIWRHIFEADPLSLEAGQRYKEAILEPGGAKDPYAMLEDLLGKEYPIGELTEAYIRKS